MKINVEKKGQHIFLILEGSLDIYTALDFKTALEEHVKTDSPDVIINMSKLTYIDSSGTGILIKALIYIQDLNGQLSIANLNPAIEKIFKVSGLTSHFDILNQEEFNRVYKT